MATPSALMRRSSPGNKTLPRLKSSAFRIWREETKTGKYTICARILKVAELKKSQVWEELSEVNDLAIQDDDKILNDIPKEIGKLQSLYTLRFTWGKLKKLPKFLYSMQLRRLQLERNKLVELDSRIKLSENLVVLDVSFNSLSKLPREIGCLTHLSLLNVSANSLSDLPDTIGTLPSLKELNVGSNNIQILPASIGQLITLECLDISSNNIPHIPDEIGYLTRLKDVRASKNHLVTLPDSFRKLVALRSLIISGNNMSSLPPCLEGCEDLATLNARDNKLSSMKCVLRKATTILLDKNCFVVIPQKVMESRHLEMLSIEDNRIKDIDRRISRVAKLRALHLGGNPIGRVPGEMCHLVELRHFSLRAAKVHTLPDEFGSLGNLTTLDLTENPLEDQLSIAYRRGVPGVMEHVKMAKALRRETEPPSYGSGEEEESGEDYQSHDSDSEADLDPVTDDSGSEDGPQDGASVLGDDMAEAGETGAEKGESNTDSDTTNTSEVRDSGFDTEDKTSDILRQTPNIPSVDLVKVQAPVMMRRPKSESHVELMKERPTLPPPVDKETNQQDPKLGKIEEREEAATPPRESYQPIGWSAISQNVPASPAQEDNVPASPAPEGNVPPAQSQTRMSQVSSNGTSVRQENRLSSSATNKSYLFTQSTPLPTNRASGLAPAKAKVETKPNEPSTPGTVSKPQTKPEIPKKPRPPVPKKKPNISIPANRGVPNTPPDPQGRPPPSEGAGRQAEDADTVAPISGRRATTNVSAMLSRFQAGQENQAGGRPPEPLRHAKSVPPGRSVDVVMRESVFPPPPKK